MFISNGLDKCITLSDKWVANIFSQSVDYLLILLGMSFTKQMFLILMKFNLPIFSIMDCTFGVVSKKALPNPRSPRFSPVLSSKRFVVLHFTIRSVIHFKLLFMKGIRSVSRFTFLCIDI